MVSTGGLEPPQLAPHAPQACVSTIPPHRLIADSIFILPLKHKFVHYCLSGGCCFFQKQPSRKMILNHFARQSTTQLISDSTFVLLLNINLSTIVSVVDVVFFKNNPLVKMILNHFTHSTSLFFGHFRGK